MSYTNAVCKTFFNFKSELSDGRRIIHAIYAQIEQRRKQNQPLFHAFERKIWRQAVVCTTVLSYEQLFKLGIENFVTQGMTEWNAICYVFYVADIVDEIARKHLTMLQYDDFLPKLENLVCTTISAKREYVERDWRTFILSEDMQTVHTKPSSTLDHFYAIGLSVLFIRICQKIIE